MLELEERMPGRSYELPTPLQGVAECIPTLSPCPVRNVSEPNRFWYLRILQMWAVLAIKLHNSDGSRHSGLLRLIFRVE